MSESSNDETSFKYCCTDTAQNPEISALVKLVLKNQQETQDIMRSTQKSIASLHERIRDFRVEDAEHNEELERLLHDLRRNQVWISRERF
ncbi:MAG: hypothetical protein ACJ71R_02205 [Nitrososphaeraceae archaeon]